MLRIHVSSHFLYTYIYHSFPQIKLHFIRYIHGQLILHKKWNERFVINNKIFKKKIGELKVSARYWSSGMSLDA